MRIKFSMVGLRGGGGEGQNLSRAQKFFNTSAKASVAVNMVERAECKRERGHRSFAGDENFLFGK